MGRVVVVGEGENYLKSDSVAVTARRSGAMIHQSVGRRGQARAGDTLVTETSQSPYKSPVNISATQIHRAFRRQSPPRQSLHCKRLERTGENGVE